MENTSIEKIFLNLREYFLTGSTLDIEFRINSLKKLKSLVIENEEEILNALKQDLGKPLMESYTAELAMIINEVNNAIKNLKKWSKPKKVRSTFLTLTAKSYIITEPYGTSLIISPWNYPFQLTLVPLIGSIAAGNCSIIKPSEFSVTSSELMKKIINSNFEKDYITVIDGDANVSKELLLQPFDKIFFTGSPNVGKIVMENAAKHLSSVTLELGGKSPCIVDKDVDIDIAAKRILWGKFLNAGQTCIAPDYLILNKDIKDQFYIALKKWIKVFYTDNPQSTEDFGRIINIKHFNRLKNYLSDGKIIIGGNTKEDELFIEPTILEIDDLNLPIMQEEIFGPILPIITYSDPQDIEKIILQNKNPLAFYVFSKNKKFINRLIQKIPFGGGCINDTLSHTMNENLSFGGRGTSGIGGYHGIHSFDCFSYKKSVLKKGFMFDIKMKYPPYKDTHTYIKKYMMK